VSSKHYLRGEARWAREQELKALGRVENLQDPRWLNHERDRRSIKARRARLELRIALADLKQLDEDRMPDTLAKAQEEADHWRHLAEGYEARIEQDEDRPMWEDA
jgi:Fe-S cluster assembly scaffold protein SufB